ncbi:HAD-IC family P-type ATPase [Texas Phoenix palm phytoplasma]|uniref:HAD-IC family P-type ATPase n=1 Tax=Texas Phoenix palm phytoplasma TaxID=176709 RepID=A0ABS5BIQ3_9MOLU|nr:cation-transporting P-type ATPase [Texas Phoenix palm phytoplasma]MBP3059468.1 HAD-IC family P-type ATPase [Texas Phoenix palm phytoplasma]
MNLLSSFEKKMKLLEKKLETNFKTGLTEEQIKKKFLKYGFNKLINNKKKNFLNQILQQLNNFFVYILLISSIITFCIGIINSQKEELFESILILSIIFINAFLGFFYEKKKENSLNLIKQKTKSYAKVLRNNEIKYILKENLLIGDIVFLKRGDLILADIRLIESNQLTVNESILTGESIPVIKNHLFFRTSESNDIVNKKHIVFMNTIILHGYGKGVVFQTGMNTQIGKITKLILNSKKEKNPLDRNIDKIAKKLSFFIIILISVDFVSNIFKYYFLNKNINFLIVKKFLLSSIALAIAVIPEGLLAIVNIILALGIKKIIKKKAIVKNLKSLETLGSISIICTDKTGTLTKNKMTIKKIYFFKENIIIEKLKNHLLNENIINLIHFGALCNNNYIIQNENNIINIKKIASDPVDQSFIDLLYLFNININKIFKKYEKIKEFPFNNEKKLMLTIIKNKKNQKKYILLKGAAEIILKLSNKIQKKEKIIIKKNNNYEYILKDFNFMAQEGYKLLGIAYIPINYEFIFSEYNDIEKILKKLKNEIIFLGTVCIEDPIKKNSLQAIKKLKQAFITPIMITGDHLITANNIAMQLNILNSEKDLSITGEKLDLLEEKEFLNKIKNIKVYARTNPKHKLRIIKTWQKLGNIVAMVGDGVNDAPSIKAANVGIAMGITGTEATKQASDIILTDDNFSTIVTAIQEGRNIFNNIQKSIIFLLSCNVGEIIVILLTTFLGHIFFNNNFVILSALQLLWINLVTDSLVAIALGMEKKEKNLMSKKPRNINNPILNKKLILKIFSEGMMIGLLTFIASFIGYKIHKNNNQYGQIFAFMVLSISQLFHSFNIRSNKSVFKIKCNFYLINCFLISILMQIIIFLIPFFRKNFKLNYLSSIDIIIITIFSILPLIIIELYKYINKKKIN